LCYSLALLWTPSVKKWKLLCIKYKLSQLGKDLKKGAMMLVHFFFNMAAQISKINMAGQTTSNFLKRIYNAYIWSKNKVSRSLIIKKKKKKVGYSLEL